MKKTRKLLFRSLFLILSVMFSELAMMYVRGFSRWKSSILYCSWKDKSGQNKIFRMTRENHVYINTFFAIIATVRIRLNIFTIFLYSIQSIRLPKKKKKSLKVENMIMMQSKSRHNIVVRYCEKSNFLSIITLYTIFHFVSNTKTKTSKRTTSNGGSLGSCIDEESCAK